MKAFEWSRRDFFKKAGAWAGAGLLQSALNLVDTGKSIAAAYPDELLSIEKFTKGKIKPEMIISKEVGSSRVDLQACKLEYSIVSPK